LSHLSVCVCGLGECSHRFSRLIYRPFFRYRSRTLFANTPVRSCALCSFAPLADPGPCSRTGEHASFVFVRLRQRGSFTSTGGCWCCCCSRGGAQVDVRDGLELFLRRCARVHLVDRVLELRPPSFSRTTCRQPTLTLRLLDAFANRQFANMFVCVRLSAVCPWRPCSGTPCSRTLFVRVRFVCIFGEQTRLGYGAGFTQRTRLGEHTLRQNVCALINGAGSWPTWDFAA